jgi:hypothetical protein
MLFLYSRSGGKPLDSLVLLKEDKLKPHTSMIAPAAASVLALSCMFVSPAHAQKAALTRDIDRPSAQPVNGTCQASTQFGSIKCNLYTVPAGKRLVVETVSYRATAPGSSSIGQVLFGQDAGYSNLILGLPNTYLISPSLIITDGGIKVYGGTQALVAYIDEGKTLAAGVIVIGATNYIQDFVFSGYLVDK